MIPPIEYRRDGTIGHCDPKWLRKELLESLGGGVRARLCVIDERRSWWSFAHIWGALIFCFIVIYAVRESTWKMRVGVGGAAILFIGTRQNALGARVHEGSHYLLFRNRRLNDSLCNWLAGYWVATDIQSYRTVHRRHHQFLHEANDPDRELYLLPEGGGAGAVLRFFLADLVGITAFKRIRLLLSGAWTAGASHTASGPSHFLGIATVHGILLGTAICLFGGLGGLSHYVVFWLLPLATVYPFVIRVRTVAEHYSEELHHPDGRPFISRTSLTDWLERYLIGADMEFHLEHHLNPAIPHYRLRQLNQSLKKRGVFERLGKQKSNVLSDGYVKFWHQLIAKGNRKTSREEYRN